jgi:hypothetical protein
MTETPASRAASEPSEPAPPAPAVQVATQREPVLPIAPAIEEMLPPRVWVSVRRDDGSPDDGPRVELAADIATIHIIAAATQPITDIALVVNGAPWDQGASWADDEWDDDGEELPANLVDKKIDIPLEAAETRIEVFATQSGGARSAPTGGITLVNVNKITPPSRLKVLAIGISEYLDERVRLALAAQDAEDIAAFFTREARHSYDDVEVEVLLDSEAKRSNILRAMDWLKEGQTRHDTSLIFVSGHGELAGTGMDKRFYFMPWEHRKGDAPHYTGISGKDVIQRLRQVPGRKIIMVDTCHSGSIADIGKLLYDFKLESQEIGLTIYAASESGDFAEDGAFTRAALQGFEGQADGVVTQTQPDQRVSTYELGVWLAHRVPELTHQVQRPTFVPLQGHPYTILKLEGDLAARP